MASEAAACEVGVHPRTGQRWAQESGGRVPAGLLGPAGSSLTFDERIQIADLKLARWSVRAIARELGRDPSTISRELRRNDSSRGYGPHWAHRQAELRRSRPKSGKIGSCPRLRQAIEDGLEQEWSPEQIACRLRRDFPDDPELHVSHETTYQALYVQGRGELRRELTKALRTGRTRRKPHRQPYERRQRFVEPMVMLSDRPAEVEDRAVPGHWEGDLIIGTPNTSAIGTLVERSTRFTMLVHLPQRHDAIAVRDGVVAAITTLPEQLRGSLTWDQGSEMGLHHEIKVQADLPVYFCDPGSPWQRGTNENTNGLLRQYFPKGTDLSSHPRDHLADVAARLNGRPRKSLGWDTPAEALTRLLSSPQTNGVATTP
ncbi:IS30 family transposase [Knoellia sp. Soil729]|uniref:IS30 family transposase n=1 Tax=Knoellia sp. Soil729 TaxID=1736394 RepID=UPI0012E8A6E8|nr:IS30 family transposase [Knoellia sp. Soil729]